METETYRLYRGTDLLGTVALIGDLCDFPWYRGQFKAAPAFAVVEILFTEELRLLETDEMDAWGKIWAQIEEPGLKLVPADGSEEKVDLLIHIEGGEARWRF